MKPFAIVLLSSLACASTPAPQPDPPAPAPREVRPPGPDERQEGAVEGGVAGARGVGASALLPPATGVAQRLADVNDPRYRPRVRPEYTRPGSAYWALFKVCVSTAGQVDNVVTLMSTGLADLDGDWIATIKSWPHRPYERNGRVTAFCYPLRLEVRMAPKRRT
jgi:hypothetical protein